MDEMSLHTPDKSDWEICLEGLDEHDEKFKEILVVIQDLQALVTAHQETIQKLQADIEALKNPPSHAALLDSLR